MKLLRRLWACVLGLFTEAEEEAIVYERPAWKREKDEADRLRRRSANICLASHGATKREKAFARRWT